MYEQALALMHELLGREETIGELLDEVGRYLFNSQWNGVKARDELTDLKNGFYIANLDTKNQPGSHWVALAVKPKVVYYFDSFARPVEKTLKLKESKRVIVQESNPDSVQPMKAEDCGQRCLAWLMLFHDDPAEALAI